MPEHSYKVKEYFVEFLGSSSSSDDADLMARVTLFSEEVKGMAADLRFYQPQKLWMKQDELSDPSDKKPTLIGHMPIDMLGSVIDVLRNEKPIYVLWLKDWNQVSLRTYLEPVGEGE